MNDALFALLRRYAFGENDLKASRQAEGAAQDFGRPLGKQNTEPK